MCHACVVCYSDSHSLTFVSLCLLACHSLLPSSLPLCSVFTLLFQFVGVEGLITGIMDMLPPTSPLGSLRREVVAAICCVICFLIDMSMVTEVRLSFRLHTVKFCRIRWDTQSFLDRQIITQQTSALNTVPFRN